MAPSRVEIVLFGPLSWSDIERVGYRKTSGAMTAAFLEEPRVQRLWYVEPPTRRGLRSSVRRVRDNLHVVTLSTPLPFERFGVIRALNRWLQANAVRRQLDSMQSGGTPRIGWFYDWFPAELTRHMPLDGCVMELTDSAEAWYQDNPAALKRLPGVKAACRARCQMIVAVAPALAPEAAGGRARVLVAPNAIDNAFLRAAAGPHDDPPELSGVPRPRLLVVGAEASLNARVDHEFLGAVLDLLPDWSLVVVGCSNRPSSGLMQLLKRERVVGVGLVTRERLASFMTNADVCAVPYRPGPVLRDNLKTYEYLACGRPVVTTGDEPELAFSGSVTSAPTPEGFAAACRRLVVGLTPERVAANRAALTERTWNRRVVTCLDACLPDLGAGK